jgi:polysaccharide biosynthesis protein PslH
MPADLLRAAPARAGRARPRLLFLCQTLPYPPDGGVAIRTYNILRLLACAFDVTALCFYRWKGGAVLKDVEASVRALSAFGRVEAFPIPQEHARGRLLADHLASVVTGRVYTQYVYRSTEFRERLRAVLASEHFDLAHVDSLDLSDYLPLLEESGIPTVCVHHNVESQLLARRADVEGSRARAAYLRLQAGRMAAEERRWGPRVALNVLVSEPDRALFERIVPGARTCVVPNGVDVERFRPADAASESAGGVVFVGGLTWFPNKDALGWFATEILPHIRARVGEGVPIHWIGRSSEEEREHFRREHGIQLSGYVDDIRPYVHRAACYVVPLRVGGGTRLKILDAWALGKAIVSTTIGCEGLDAVDGANMLVRDTPERFAAAVAEVLESAALREELGAAGRRTVEEIYSWDVIGRNMIAEYGRLL